MGSDVRWAHAEVTLPTGETVAGTLNYRATARGASLRIGPTSIEHLTDVEADRHADDRVTLTGAEGVWEVFRPNHGGCGSCGPTV